MTKRASLAIAVTAVLLVAGLLAWRYAGPPAAGHEAGPAMGDAELSRQLAPIVATYRQIIVRKRSTGTAEPSSSIRNERSPT